MRHMHPAIAAYINKEFGPNTVVAIDDRPYWCKIRFQFTIAGVLAITTRQAFGYGIGDLRGSAGFTAGAAATDPATMADTNLQKKGETVLGAHVFVEGVTAFMTPSSDPALAKRVVEECAVTFTTDGQRVQPLARLEMIPAGGGFHGHGPSAIKEPPLNVSGIVDGGPGADQTFMNNGMPVRGNFFPLGSPVLWSAASSKGSDSNFRLNFDIGRAISEPVTALRAGGAGVQPYNPPAAAGDPGTFVDYVIGLAITSISLPSTNG